jgi:hypothetical protein
MEYFRILLFLLALQISRVCAMDWGMSPPVTELYLEEMTSFVVRITDAWPVADMMEHFLPGIVTVVTGLMMIAASPARSMSCSANEVLIILTQLGMVYTAVDVEGVFTTANVVSWVIPALNDDEVAAAFARMVSSFSRLSNLLSPALERALAQQAGIGAQPFPAFADLQQDLRGAPPELGEGFPNPCDMPPVGGNGTTATGTGCTRYIVFLAVFLAYSFVFFEILNSRMAYAHPADPHGLD